MTSPRTNIVRPILWLCLPLYLMALASCGSKPSAALIPTIGPPVKNLADLQYLFQPGAIEIGLVAATNLNTTGSVPAALTICLYQLSDTKWFKANTNSPQGLRQLLDCQGSEAGQTPQPEVILAARYLIQPGETRDLSLDRLGGTKFLGVVGGFSSLPSANATGLLVIPVHENKKLIFSNTFELENLAAWLLLYNQSLVFFPKSQNDLKVSASHFSQIEPPPTPPDCQPQSNKAICASSPPSTNPADINPPANIVSNPANINPPANIVSNPANINPPANAFSNPADLKAAPNAVKPEMAPAAPDPLCVPCIKPSGTMSSEPSQSGRP